MVTLAVVVMGVLIAVCDLNAAPRMSAERRAAELQRLQKERAFQLDRMTRSLEELAVWCDERNRDEDARSVRELIARSRNEESPHERLPRQMQGEIPNSATSDDRYFLSQRRVIRQRYADELFKLTRAAVNGQFLSIAYNWVHEVAFHSPDHVAARKVLGYVKHADEWVSPFEKQMLRDRKVWVDGFGWLPQAHVDRYRKGERYCDSRWMSAAKEAELRREFSKAWVVQTEHYVVKTNHSLERGVEVAQKLEGFHEVFFQSLAGFFNDQKQAEAMFFGQAAAKPRPANRVNYFRLREEYIRELKARTEQRIEITQGIYFPGTGEAYFYDNPEAKDDSVLYHEATHQLMSAARPGIGNIGMLENFWAIEGIACYMESFRKTDDGFTVGNPQHGRLLAARHHLLRENYFVPIRELASMGMTKFQQAPEISKNYSQSAALAHFFMHYRDGVYRDDFVEHLSQIYRRDTAGRNRPESIESLTGVSFEELDSQYREHIAELDRIHGPTVELQPASE